MARLILSMDGLVLKEIPLNKEHLTIGRRQTARRLEGAPQGVWRMGKINESVE